MAQNEYLVDGADMTTVADAIREKGGTTAPLSFPAGMAEAVRNIQSGAVSSVNGKTGAVELVAGDVGAVPAPETASVGQTIVVKAVDESGKPTEWEAANVAAEWELLGDTTVGIAVDFEPISIADGVVTIDPTAENYSELIDGDNSCAILHRDIIKKNINAGCINCILAATDYQNGVFALMDGDRKTISTAYDVSKYKIAKKAVVSVSMSGIKQYKQYRLLYESIYSCTHGSRTHFDCNIKGLHWGADKYNRISGGISLESTISPVGDGSEFVYVKTNATLGQIGGNIAENTSYVKIYPASYGKAPSDGVLKFTLATDIFYKGARFRVWGSNK